MVHPASAEYKPSHFTFGLKFDGELKDLAGHRLFESARYTHPSTKAVIEIIRQHDGASQAKVGALITDLAQRLSIYNRERMNQHYFNTSRHYGARFQHQHPYNYAIGVLLYEHTGSFTTYEMDWNKAAKDALKIITACLENPAFKKTPLLAEPLLHVVQDIIALTPVRDALYSTRLFAPTEYKYERVIDPEIRQATAELLKHPILQALTDNQGEEAGLRKLLAAFSDSKQEITVQQFTDAAVKTAQMLSTLQKHSPERHDALRKFAQEHFAEAIDGIVERHAGYPKTHKDGPTAPLELCAAVKAMPKSLKVWHNKWEEDMPSRIIASLATHNVTNPRVIGKIAAALS